MDHGIERGDSNEGVEDGGLVVVDSVLVQDKDDVGEGAQRDDEHHEEDLNVFDDFRDHADESAEWLEQAHPVEELEPH